MGPAAGGMGGIRLAGGGDWRRCDGGPGRGQARRGRCGSLLAWASALAEAKPGRIDDRAMLRRRWLAETPSPMIPGLRLAGLPGTQVVPNELSTAKGLVRISLWHLSAAGHCQIRGGPLSQWSLGGCSMTTPPSPPPPPPRPTTSHRRLITALVTVFRMTRSPVTARDSCITIDLCRPKDLGGHSPPLPCPQ